MLVKHCLVWGYSRLLCAAIGALLLLVNTSVSAGITDADSDNIDDVFEAANGLNPAVDDALDDLDADGFTNLAEYRLGSDPNDALSLPPELGNYFESFEAAAPSFWFSPGNPDWYDWLWTDAQASDAAASLYATTAWADYSSGAVAGKETVIALVVNAADSYLTLDLNGSGCNILYDFDEHTTQPYVPYSLGEIEIRVNGEVRYQRPACGSPGWSTIPKVPLPAGEQRIEIVHRVLASIGAYPVTTGDETVWLDALRIATANPTDAQDSDADGLSDYDEGFVHGTDVHSWDTDNDDMSDFYEVNEGTNPRVDDRQQDRDGDGFSNSAEYYAGSSAGNPSSGVPLSGSVNETFDAFASGLPSPWFVVGNPADSWWADSSNSGWQWQAASELTFSVPGTGALVYQEGAPRTIGYVAHLAEPSVATVTYRTTSPPGGGWNCDVYLPPVNSFYWKSPYSSGVEEAGTTTRQIYLMPGVHELRFQQSYGLGYLTPSACEGMPVIQSFVIEPDTSVDTDNDGLTDVREYFRGTSADNPDSDGDGLSDGAEVNQYGSNPLNANSDGDEFDDGDEVGLGLSPVLPYDSLLDADGDQHFNLVELLYESDLHNADSTPPIPAFADGRIISFESAADVLPWLGTLDGAEVEVANSVEQSVAFTSAYHGDKLLSLYPGSKFRLYINARANTLMDFHLFRQPRFGNELKVRQSHPSTPYSQSLLYLEAGTIECCTATPRWVQIEALQLRPGPNVVDFEVVCNVNPCTPVYIDYIHFKLDPNVVVPAPAVVSIDIDPASVSNLIDLDIGQNVAVAMLSTSIADGDSVDFDATAVSGSSVRFGPAQAQSPYPTGLYADVDNDGDTDMLLAFPPAASGFQCDQAGDAELTGTTVYGQEFSGADAFVTSECATSSCHP